MRHNRLIHEAGLSYNINLKHEIRFTGRSWLSQRNKDPVEEAQLAYSFYY
jgi:hypothetical protein